MQTPITRRTFAAALAALTAGQIVRPTAAQSEPAAGSLPMVCGGSPCVVLPPA